MTVLKPPFSYYGAKGRLAPWLASLLPEHTSYVEPFAGSAAVLLAKSPARYEILNDLDGDVVTFWRVLREEPDRLIRALSTTPYARDEYLACQEGHTAVDLVERARRFFVRSCMGFNASPVPGAGFSATHPNKAPKAATFSARIGRLAQVSKRIRDVEIENTDALTLLERWNQPGTVAYLDPPYLGDTRTAHHRAYETNSESEAFHARLISVLQDFTGQAVLSGYASQLYETGLPEWRRIDREVYASTASGATSSRRIECVWVNFEATL